MVRQFGQNSDTAVVIASDKGEVVVKLNAVCDSNIVCRNLLHR